MSTGTTPSHPVEVAKHQVTTPGSPREDAHYPRRPGCRSGRAKPRTAAEAQFLAIGDGTELWLAVAVAAGAFRVRAKMAQAVQLAAVQGTGGVDRAPGRAGPGGPAWPLRR